MLEPTCQASGRLYGANSAENSAIRSWNARCSLARVCSQEEPQLTVPASFISGAYSVSTATLRRGTPVTGTMTDDRRRHERVVGPFDGRRLGMIDTDVQIYDLSQGGCFVTSTQEPEQGKALMLEIDLPHEGRITVHAKTLYCRAGFGFAAQFINLTEETRLRIERALQEWIASKGY